MSPTCSKITRFAGRLKEGVAQFSLEPVSCSKTECENNWQMPSPGFMRYKEERASQNTEHLGYAFRNNMLLGKKGTVREIRLNYRHSCT